MGSAMAKRAEENAEFWHKMLEEGDRGMRAWRRVVRHIPTSPRCKFCLGPFAGIGGRIFRLTGFGPSRKNPLFCNG